MKLKLALLNNNVHKAEVIKSITTRHMSDKEGKMMFKFLKIFFDDIGYVNNLKGEKCQK